MDYKRYPIYVDWDSMRGIIVAELKRDLQSLAADLDVVQKKQSGFVFSTDFKKDQAAIKKHIDAIKLIVEYYGDENEST